MAGNELDEILERIDQKNLPPVHLWKPQYTGEMDMRIAADGNWYYQGSIISRARMVKLFSTILRFEDGQHFLVTPVEKYLITVEDAAFVATQVDKVDVEQQVLVFITNVAEEIVADSEHRIIVNTDPVSNEPRPYLQVRDGLTALISRNVFYQLVEWANPVLLKGTEHLVVQSRGECFSLGQL